MDWFTPKLPGHWINNKLTGGSVLIRRELCKEYPLFYNTCLSGLNQLCMFKLRIQNEKRSW